jgi:hypothetical protein
VKIARNNFGQPPELDRLRPAGVTHLFQSCEPVRHPRPPRLLLTEFAWRATTSPRWGSHVSTITSFRHADAITPTEPLSAVAVSPSGIGLPLNSGGSASATSHFRGRAPPVGWSGVHSRFGLPVRSITQGELYQSTSTHVVTSLRRSGCFRPSDRLAGWDSHPLEISDFHGILD